MDNIN
jgi:hypothetical protein